MLPVIHKITEYLGKCPLVQSQKDKHYKLCSKLTIKRLCDVFIVNSEHIWYLFLMFLLWSLSMYLFAGMEFWSRISDVAFVLTVFRTQGTNIVQLNTKLWADMCCEKVKEKSIRITAMDHETQEVKVYLISVWHFR